VAGRHAAGRRSSSRTQRALQALGLSAAALAGGVTLAAAILQFGDLVPLPGGGNIHRLQPAPPAIYHPAGERSGCTQAPIDRTNGLTAPADCHATAPGHRIQQT
jgi:hypothetical protein